MATRTQAQLAAPLAGSPLPMAASADSEVPWNPPRGPLEPRETHLALWWPSSRAQADARAAPLPARGRPSMGAAPELEVPWNSPEGPFESSFEWNHSAGTAPLEVLMEMSSTRKSTNEVSDSGSMVGGGHDLGNAAAAIDIDTGSSAARPRRRGVKSS